MPVAKGTKHRSAGSGGPLSSLLALVALVAVAKEAWQRPTPARAGSRQPGRSAAAEGIVEGAPAAPQRPPSPLVLKVDRWQRDRPRWAFVFAVVKKFADDRAGYLAALVSYFAFFSLFPLLLALTSILGFVLEGNQGLQDDVKNSAADQVPLIGDTIKNNIGELHGSVFAIVFGVLTALWAGLRVIDAIQNALNDVWDVPLAGRPKLVKRRTRGVLALGVLGLALVASMAASTLAGLLPDLPGAGRAGVFAITLLFNVGLFLVAFQVLSEVRHPWGVLWPGAIVAAVGWWALQTFGATYLSHVLKDAEGTYKDFGTVIGLLTFFFVTSQVVILAAEVNVVKARHLWPRSLLARAEGLTDADRRAYADYAGAQRRVLGQVVEVTYQTEPAAPPQPPQVRGGADRPLA